MKVVILNDGETFTDIEGCVILEIPHTLLEADVNTWVKENYDKGIPLGGNK